MRCSFSYQGQTWDLEGRREDWPEEVQVHMDRLAPRVEPGLCGFGDWKCTRPEAGYLCGGAPHFKRSKCRYPYWSVYSMLTDPVPELAAQQLSFFDPPERIWHMLGTGLPMSKRQWWVAVYHCKAGAMWGATKERELLGPATRIEVVKIEKVSPRKVVCTAEEGCW